MSYVRVVGGWLLLLVGLYIPTVCVAQEDAALPIVVPQAVGQQQDAWRVFGGLRVQQGEAGERVFLGPFLLSDLTWDIQDLTYAGGGFVWQPVARFALQAEYWRAVSDGGGSMTDYDYLLPSIWTHYSDGRVEVNAAYTWDVRGVWEPLSGAWWGLQALGGFERMFWDWSQFGGDYIYSSEEGFRDLRGSFPASQNGINYRQTFEIPYLGIGARAQWRACEAELRFLYSPVVQADGWDEHVLRNLYFTDTFRNITYLALEGSVRYLMGNHVFLQGDLDWHHLPEARGDLTTIDPVAGTEETVSDAGGIENRALSATLALGARW